MARIYGHKWTSIAEADDGTWLAGLQDLKPSQIAIGLGNLLQAGTEWPPSLPEFRDLCLNKVKEEKHWQQRIYDAAEKEDLANKALPILKAQEEVKKSNMAEIRKKLGIKK